MLSKLTEEGEVFDFKCEYCGDNKFSLSFLRSDEGTTLLAFCCSNPDCQQKLREDMDTEEGVLAYTNAFDITGQEPDEILDTEPRVLN